MAGRILHEAQVQAVGDHRDFTIERPSDTLRRRLMIDQNIPVSYPESRGSADLVRIQNFPEPRKEEDPADDPNRKPTIEVKNLQLLEALRLAAASSSVFQTRKETVFRAALDLDLARHDFDVILTETSSGSIESTLEQVPLPLPETGTEHTRTTGIKGTTEAGLSKKFENGAEISTSIGFDIVKLLTAPYNYSSSIFADASITIPLLRGSGEDIVREPLTQAERNTLYALLDFEHFKRDFAVQILSSYLGVLQDEDRVQNAEQNYRSLKSAARQLRRLADAGRRPEIEVDQAVQNELSARDSWIRSIQTLENGLDAFRVQVGLPPDVELTLDRTELARLGDQVKRSLGTDQDEAGLLDRLKSDAAPMDAPIVLEEPGAGMKGPYEIEEHRAIELALHNRLDLRVAHGRVVDAERTCYVAADRLRAELTLLGAATFGEHRSISQATEPDSEHLRYNEAFYNSIITLDLPLDRVLERDQYRATLIDLEESIRDLQVLEDGVKQDVRERLRTLLEAREGQRIQAAAVALAKRRVSSAKLFLEAGRAEVRDLLEAQEALVSAQNDLTAALIDYRIAELELQRDMGMLEVSEGGVFVEFDPLRSDHEPIP